MKAKLHGSAALAWILTLGLAAATAWMAPRGAAQAPAASTEGTPRQGEPAGAPAAAGAGAAPVGAATAPAAGTVPARRGQARYLFLLASNRAGTATSALGSNGERLYTFEFNDRGRGSKLASTIVVDAHGIPLRQQTTGYDYWKKPVDERFELADGKATWSSSAEKGEREVARRSFYLAVNGLPSEIELLVGALLASRNRIALLPDGEARLEKVAGAQAPGPGFQRPVTLYAVSGLDFSPTYVWVDQQGKLFAQFDGWSTLVLEEWESALPLLTRIQEQAAAQRERALVQRLARRAQGTHGPLAVRGARLFDPQTGQVQTGITVLVSGNHVEKVGRDEDVEVPFSAEVIDARGKMLLPGLWDMHVHLTPTDGILHLAAGVTSVRDMANDIDKLNDLRRRWDGWEALGPRVLMAGFIDGPGPFAGPSKVLVSNEADALAAVDRYYKLGYVQIKLYSSLDPKLVPPIVARAHQLGMRVSGHIPNGLSAEQAVRAGFNEIQHVNFLFLNFIPGVDTRTPARFIEVARHAADLDLRSPEVRAFIALLKERQVAVDPTLDVFENMFTGKAGEVNPSLAAVVDRLPLVIRRSLYGGGLAPPGMEDTYRRSYRNLLAMVRALHEAGVTIEAGTDSLAGFELHRELELYVEAGLPPAQVLRIATLGAARVVGRDKELGSIAPGKLADFILVDGDPTARISDIRRVVLTVKDGVPLDPAELYKTVGVKP
jgi:imidazolonepropionase-like amidohydrolase